MNKRKKNPPRIDTRGFTLVELSIVLVIIGLIIGGVLTGQQVIQNARVTKAVNDVQGYESQFQTYQQNYGTMPGDDLSAISRFPNVTGVANGDGNGSLGGTFDTASSTAETAYAWADLRASGLVKNQTPVTGQPQNPFSGVYGFQNGAFSSAISTTTICLNNVPGGAAQAIDTRLDDGTPNAGNVQAMVYTGTAGESVAGTPATSYASSSNYTMCIKM